MVEKIAEYEYLLAETYDSIWCHILPHTNYTAYMAVLAALMPLRTRLRCPANDCEKGSWRGSCFPHDIP